MSFRGAIIQKKDRAASPDKKLFQCQNLPAVAQRILRKQPHFRQRVEDHSSWVNSIHRIEHFSRCLTQLYFGGMIHRHLGLVGRFTIFRNQFDDVDAFDRPAMRRGPRRQFFLGFRESDVKALFLVFVTFAKELNRQRSFARARVTFQKIQPVRNEPAVEDVIQPRYAGG